MRERSELLVCLVPAHAHELFAGLSWKIDISIPYILTRGDSTFTGMNIGLEGMNKFCSFV